MKMIVTGAAGFIGSHLCEQLLDSGNRVIGIDSFLDYYPRWIKEMNLENLRKAPDFSFLEQSLLEVNWRELLDGTHTIFHLAAQAGVRTSWGGNFVIYTKNNIDATQRLLEESKNSKLEKFVYASTSSVYGDTPDTPMREESALNPVSPYGVTKMAAEGLCHLYWTNYGVPCVSLRYFTVYGPRQRPDMGFYKFLLAILEQRPITIYEDGNQTRDFTYVKDIVQGTILAAEKGREGQSYNLGGGTTISVNEVLKMIGDITGSKSEFRYAEKQKGDMRHTYASIRKAQEDFRYSPAVSLHSGLTEQYQWMKDLHQRGLTCRMD